MTERSGFVDSNPRREPQAAPFLNWAGRKSTGLERTPAETGTKGQGQYPGLLIAGGPAATVLKSAGTHHPRAFQTQIFELPESAQTYPDRGPGHHHALLDMDLDSVHLVGEKFRTVVRDRHPRRDPRRRRSTSTASEHGSADGQISALITKPVAGPIVDFNVHSILRNVLWGSPSSLPPSVLSGPGSAGVRTAAGERAIGDQMG